MKYIVTLITIIASLTSCSTQNTQHNKMDTNNIKLLNVISNTKERFYVRKEAVAQIDLTRSKNYTIAVLKKTLNRKRPETPVNLVDSDPLSEERIIDLHIIEVLNKLANKSENYRIPALVSQAIPAIGHYKDEREEAAKVIKSINDKKLYAEIVELTKSENTIIVENAVTTLNNINFPNAPIGGDISGILSSEKIKIKYSRLKEEMELYPRASQGKIELSSGVKEFIDANNYQRGNIDAEASLIDMLEVMDWHFNYYIENEKVIICTIAEAAKRWQNWTGL